MKNTILIFSLFFLTSNLLAQTNTKKNDIKIPMVASSWDYTAGDVEFIEHRSTQAMKIMKARTSALLKDIEFEKGTIEFDVEVVEGPFVGINFRRKDAQEAERLYLRPYRAGNLMGGDAVQYAPIVKGVNLWDLFGAYQSNALIKKEGWNHIKMVISEQQMQVFVNDMQHAALEIPELCGNTSIGSISLDGNAIFANLTISPNATADLADKLVSDHTSHDPRYLRNWSHTIPVAFPEGRDIIFDDLPNESTKWQEILAERFGLVNLTRLYGSDKNDERRLVWLKTNIQSDRAQERKINLGFSDEVWVYINGQFLYIDKNYYANAVRKEPNGRCDISNASFPIPLQEGDNELLIGVSNFFFGWGIVARMDEVEGIRFD